MRATRAGGDRQRLHECLRGHSLVAWRAVESGEPNPLAALVAADPEVTRWLAAGEILETFAKPSTHVGDAPARARAASAAAEARIAGSSEGGWNSP
jgi:adenylosuccinate lyase